MSIHFDRVGKLSKLTSDSNLKGWKSRYIGLNNLKRELYVWNNQNEYENHLKSLSSNWIELVLLHSSSIYVSDYLDQSYGFEISTPTGNHFLAAEDQNSLNDWLHALMASGATAKAPSKEIVLFQPEGTGNNKLLEYRKIITDSYAKYGFLQKRGALNTAYKTRFFRTAENASGQKALIYFKQPDSSYFQGAILLDGAKIEDCDNPAFEFKIITKERIYQIRSHSKAEKNSWIAVLQALCGGENEVHHTDLSNPAFNSIVAEDLYAALGLNPTTANAASISAAYKEKAKEFHPDRNKDPQASTMFNLVSTANEILGSPVRRAEYEYKRKLYLENNKNGGGAIPYNNNGSGGDEKQSGGIIQNLAEADSLDNGKRYKQRQKKNQNTNEEKQSDNAAAAPLIQQQSNNNTSIDQTPIRPTHTSTQSNSNQFQTPIPISSAISSAANSAAATTTTTTNTNSSSSSPPPVDAVRVGDDGKVYRHRVVKKPQVAAAADEKVAEEKSTATTTANNEAAASSPSSHKPTHSISPSRSISPIEISFNTISSHIALWQRGFAVFKLSHGWSSFKSTQLYIQPTELSIPISYQSLFHLKWDSNTKSSIILDGNFIYHHGIENCSEWKKPENIKKLIKNSGSAAGAGESISKFVFEIIQSNTNKISSFAATNQDQFQSIRTVLEWIQSDNRRKVDEKLNMLTIKK